MGLKKNYKLKKQVNKMSYLYSLYNKIRFSILIIVARFLNIGYQQDAKNFEKKLFRPLLVSTNLIMILCYSLWLFFVIYFFPFNIWIIITLCCIILHLFFYWLIYLGNTLIARCIAFQSMLIWMSLIFFLFGAFINMVYFLIVQIFFIRFYFNNTSENKIYYWFLIQSMAIVIINECFACVVSPPLYILNKSQVIFINYSVFCYIPFLFFLIPLNNKIIAVNNLKRCNKIIEILKIRGEKMNNLTQDIQRLGLSTSLNIKTPIFLIESLLKNTQKDLLNRNKTSHLNNLLLIKESRNLIDSYCSGLFFHKMTHEAMKLDFIKVNLKSTIDMCVLALGIDPQNQTIKNGTHDIDIFTNIELFKIIINILIDNGLKYNQRSPYIFITSSIEKRNLIIKIVDNGIGIDKAFIKSIFLPFNRIHSVSRNGSGLGLYSALIASNRLNSEIYIENSDKNGSIFVLKIKNCIV